MDSRRKLVACKHGPDRHACARAQWVALRTVFHPPALTQGPTRMPRSVCDLAQFAPLKAAGERFKSVGAWRGRVRQAKTAVRATTESPAIPAPMARTERRDCQARMVRRASRARLARTDCRGTMARQGRRYPRASQPSQRWKHAGSQGVRLPVHTDTVQKAQTRECSHVPPLIVSEPIFTVV